MSALSPPERGSTRPSLKALSNSLRNKLSVPIARVVPQHVPFQVDVQAHDVEIGQPYLAWQDGSQTAWQGQHVDSKNPGTHTGPWVGYASKPWLHSEIVKDVNELTSFVDQFVTKRECDAFAIERATLQGQIVTLSARVSSLEDQVAQLERIMPVDGDFANIRKELVEVEKDCDYYFELYEKEVEARMGAEQAITDAIARLDELDAEFNALRELFNKKVGFFPVSEAPPHAAELFRVQQFLHSPAMAAEAQVGLVHPAVAHELIEAIKAERRKHAWPNPKKILLRAFIAALWLCSLAAAILATYFITVNYT